jgi:hypothetical protein
MSFSPPIWPPGKSLTSIVPPSAAWRARRSGRPPHHVRGLLEGAGDAQRHGLVLGRGQGGTERAQHEAGHELRRWRRCMGVPPAKRLLASRSQDASISRKPTQSHMEGPAAGSPAASRSDDEVDGRRRDGPGRVGMPPVVAPVEFGAGRLGPVRGRLPGRAEDLRLRGIPAGGPEAVPRAPSRSAPPAAAGGPKAKRSASPKGPCARRGSRPRAGAHPPRGRRAGRPWRRRPHRDRRGRPSRSRFLSPRSS